MRNLSLFALREDFVLAVGLLLRYRVCSRSLQKRRWFESRLRMRVSGRIATGSSKSENVPN